MVVPSPMPTTPSLQNSFTSIRVCPCMVATDSRCGRIVGRSTRQVSTRSTVARDGAEAAVAEFMASIYTGRGRGASNTVFYPARYL